MDLQLRGKRALVTGSTAGIGFAAAAGSTGRGPPSSSTGGRGGESRRPSPRSGTQGGDGEVSGIAADLSTAEGVAELVRQLPEVDILVNNLGIFEPKPFEEIPDEDWLRFFEVNVMSGVRLTRHYLPGMKARNWGRIVFVSSESGVQIPAEMIHYGMTKTAQLAIARGVAEIGRRDGHHGQQRAAGSDRIGGRGPVRGRPGEAAGRGPRRSLRPSSSRRPARPR